MINDIKSSLVVFEGNLLEEDVEFVFDFLGLMEEIELLLLFLGQEGGDDLLKLCRSSLKTDFIGSQ